jgi:DNA-directed RNA polymerase specialized sigma24 family protein
MAHAAAAPIDQKTIERYQRDFYSQTDVVYRFGVVLTGSRDGAERLTEDTFRSIIEDFSEIKSGDDPVEVLLRFAWRSWQKISNERFHDWMQPTVNALRKLDREQRAALYLVDMIGVNPKNTAVILEASEREVRENLAVARRRLTTGEISLL